MANDPVPDLVGRVRALTERPLDEHPDVLEDVHRSIVAELDRVGARPAGDEAPPGSSPADEAPADARRQAPDGETEDAQAETETSPTQPGHAEAAPER